jgi:RNA polymerase sigma-70 factor, ECF subfamily
MPNNQTEFGDPSSAVADLIAELYGKSGAENLDLSHEQFAAILIAICKKQFPSGATDKETKSFLSGLRIEDLALARACAAGSERAWETFLTRFRAKLYETANYIARESSAARELADSLYAELYGLGGRDGERASKLNFYTGRGSLDGWLRTVLSQEYVNRYRKQKRLVSLDEQEEGGVQFAAPEAFPQASSTPATEPRIESAVDRALSGLSPEDRFVLASYYLDERTLADIARSLSVHESTISRKLDKLAKALQKSILKALITMGMSRRQAQEAMDLDVRDLTVNIRAKLSQDQPAGAFLRNKAETEKQK